LVQPELGEAEEAEPGGGGEGAFGQPLADPVAGVGGVRAMMKDTNDPARRPSAVAIDDLTKVAVETLYKEFQRVQAKSVATDDWFFRFLSIAVIPFLGFLGYSAITPQYRILVAALPMLSLVGILVVFVLSSHYAYANIYGDYLQREINRLLGSDVMRDNIFGAAAYNKFTPVMVSYGIGFSLLFAVNILAAPFITKVVDVFYKTNSDSLGKAGIVLQHYWPITLTLLAVTAIIASTALFATQRRLRLLAVSLASDAKMAVTVASTAADTHHAKEGTNQSKKKAPGQTP
jgi:hypothetical protein